MNWCWVGRALVLTLALLIPSFKYVSGNLKLEMTYSHTDRDAVRKCLYFLAYLILVWSLISLVSVQEMVDWTDTSSPIAVQWMRFGSWEGDDKSYQIRNIRNPTKQMESCINKVGSFDCSSLDEEYIGGREIRDEVRYC